VKFLLLPIFAIPAMAAQSITLRPSTIPGVELTAMQSQSPYEVALTNRTEHTIVGFTILWVWAAGSSQNITYAGVTMEQLSPEVSWVRPGQTVTRAPREPLTGAANVEILLDAVRFDDRFAGPDSRRAYETAQAIAATRYSLAEAILARQAAGESASSIVEWLQAIPAQTFRPGADFPVNGAGGGRSSRSDPSLIAAQFVLTYRSAGETALYDLARRYRHPLPKLYR
jgi:hypothetical protein